MSTFPTLIARLIAGRTGRAKAARAAGRRAPACESLEGRRLLNAGWAPAGSTAAGANVPAHVHHFGPHAEGPHGPGNRGHHAPPALSAQAQADLKTLRADLQALQAEVPADLAARVKADHATIEQALARLAPAPPAGTTPGAWNDHHGGPLAHKPGADAGFPGPGLGFPGPGARAGTDPTAGLTAMLKKAGIADAQAATIVADFQAYQTALKTLDPTLQARITADQAAVTRDLPAGHVGPPGFPGPGGPPMF